MDKSKKDIETLTQIFDRTRVAAKLRQMVRDAKLIDGAAIMSESRAYVTRKMEAQDSVIEWKVLREPPVLFIPLKYGNALLPLMEVPVLYCNFYMPVRKSLRAARRGECIYGMKRRNKLHHFIMSKAIVERLLDPLERREAVMSRDVAALESFVTQSGLSVTDLLDLLRQKTQETKGNIDPKDSTDPKNLSL